MDRKREAETVRRPEGRSATDRNRRVWTDQRDGTRWTVRAFWSPDEMMAAQVVFKSSPESYETWWVSHQTLPRLTEPELESLLDEARSG